MRCLICLESQLSDDAIRGLIKAHEPSYKGNSGSGEWLRSSLIFNLDVVYDDVINGRVEGFSKSDIHNVNSLACADVYLFEVTNPDS